MQFCTTERPQFFEFEVATCRTCRLRSKKAILEVAMSNLQKWQGFAQSWGPRMPIWHPLPFIPPQNRPQLRQLRAVGRSKNSGGGAHSKGVGIICPPGWDIINWSAKKRGHAAAAPTRKQHHWQWYGFLFYVKSTTASLETMEPSETLEVVQNLKLTKI